MKYLLSIIAALVLVFGLLYWIGNNSPSKTVSKELISEKTITHGHGLSVDSADPSKLYIATHHGLLVLLNEKDLYRIGTGNDDYMGFSAHPTEPKIFYSSGHPENGGNTGLQKSEDGGFTWKKISDGLNGPVDFHALTISAVNSNLIYGWYQGYIQRSMDGGKSWVKYATQFPIVTLVTNATDENIVYAASPLGLYISKDKGEKWDKLIEGFVSTIAVNPKDSKKMLSFSEKFWLARSNNEGASWEEIGQNFDGETPLFMSFEKQKGEFIYALTEKNSIYKSSDAGETWTKIR
ncbi:MAG: hypothetical protein M3Q44_00140 [bacterium]|nr:hypothetical protein [bacterium]